MATTREEIRHAVHELLNDVIEQGFHHLVNHPQQSTELNEIISEATQELNYQLMKVDAHSFAPETEEVYKHYQSISHDTQRSSLQLLSRLQKVRETANPRLRRA
jgi:oligoribonuclease NrnB/cAMP/cGMP phosphodiesterase (DHH superfamily)